MPILDSWDLDLDADRVLWGQGADPAVLRTRRPGLVRVAEQAIENGRTLLAPRVLYQRLPVRRVVHERVVVDGGALSGPLIGRQLAPASEVIVALCTVGGAIEEQATACFNENPVVSLALYGVGSAAAEALAEAACRRFEEMAAAEGLKTGVPLNPGMIGWPVEQGQSEIFRLVPARSIGVELTAAGFIKPLKSLSFVMGLGPDLTHDGCTCDYCSMRDTCRHRSHAE